MANPLLFASVVLWQAFAVCYVQQGIRFSVSLRMLLSHVYIQFDIVLFALLFCVVLRSMDYFIYVPGELDMFNFCSVEFSCCLQNIRERSLFMAGVGTEEKALYPLKKGLPHHLLKSNFLYPTEGKQ